MQQFEEPDTLLLTDFTDLASINAQGGILHSGTNTAQDPVDYSFEAGKFTPAIRPLATNQGTHVYYPIDGLLGHDEFTVELWAMHATTDWTALSSKTLFSIETGSLSMPFGLHAGGLAAYWGIHPNNTTGDAVSIEVVQSLAGLGLTVGTWHSVALTLSGGSVRVYIDGVLRKTVAGVVLPTVIADQGSLGAGLFIAGRPTLAASGFAVSDVRVSATARAPNAMFVRRSMVGHLDVDTTSNAGAIPAQIIGSLGPAPYVGSDYDQIHDALRMARVGSIVHATPIKAGGTDATHPTLGQSGSYSYDWQVVDRTLGEMVRLGQRLFVNLDSCPQVLGGPAPLSGINLTTHMANYAPGSATIPNDMAAWATICQDFVHRILVTLDIDVAMWGFVNEVPWPMATYMNFWVATAQAIRAVDPTAYLVGLDTGAYTPTWVDGIMAKCAAVGDRTLVNAISYHEYSGDLQNWHEVRAMTDDYATANGYATPFPIVLGEFNWSNRSMHRTTGIGTVEPGYFESTFLHVMAFGAAYTTAFIARALADPGVLQGLCFSHISAYSGDPRVGGYDATQLISRLAEVDADEIADQFAPYNALVGVQQTIGNQRLTIDTTQLPPGIHAYAGKDTVTGRIGVMIASHGWANRSTRTVHLHLPGMTGSKRLRRYLVDPTHSSRWDVGEDTPAGDPHQDLELMEDRTDTAVRLRDIPLEVPKWSATFLLIDPA